MKRLFVSLVGILALGALSLPVAADAPTGQATYPLAWTFDLDGEAADADQVIVVGDGVLADAKVFNLTANPDVCRLVDITVNDVANITAGTLTVTGTDCWDDTLVTKFDFTGADDDGVKALTVVSGYASGAYYKTITDVRTGALTGEGGADTITMGYTTNCPTQYVAYGRRAQISDLSRGVDLAATFPVAIRIQNNTTTTLTATTAASAPFTNVSVGDLLYLPVKGAAQVRKVTAKADNDNVTVNEAISMDTASFFSFAKFYISSDPYDGFLAVSGWDGAMFVFDVDANANTGGTVSTVECAMIPKSPIGTVIVDTDTVASGATGTATTSIDFRLAPFRYCRFGMKFGTNDDGDGAAENINVALALRK